MPDEFYPNVIEDPYDHPNWVELEHGGGTGDHLRVITYETNTGQVRMTGPTIIGERRIHPAP